MPSLVSALTWLHLLFPARFSLLPGPCQTVLAFSAWVSGAKGSLGQDLGGSGAFWKPSLGEGRLLISVQLTGAALLMRCWGLVLILVEGCEGEGGQKGVITLLNQVRGNGLCKSSSTQRGVFKDISAFVPRGMSFMVN